MLTPARALAVAACVPALIAVGAPSPAVVAAPAPALGRLNAPGPAGTVDTVAGPGFCASGSRHARSSEILAGVAVDRTGTLWFQTGPPGEGLITKVVNNVSVVVNRTGVDTSAVAASDGNVSHSTHASASRLAADGGDALLMAQSTAIVRLGEGLQTLAGAPEAASGPGAGDGGTLRGARFARISAIATDPTGNVYVADEIDGEVGRVDIRFLNRSDQPVIFYGGTSRQRTVDPGTIGTIASTVVQRRTGGGGADGRALVVAGDRLYLTDSVPGLQPRAVVRLVNLGGTHLDAHGKTIPPGETADVATVPSRDQPPRPGVPAGLSPLPGIAADDRGNLFLAEQTSHRVSKVDAGGRLTPVAGTGTAGFNGNDRHATRAQLNRPFAVAVGPGGRLYISDAGNGQVRFVDDAGTLRSALGNGATQRWECATESSPPALRFGESPVAGQIGSLAVGSSGQVFLASASLDQVQHLTGAAELQPVAGRLPPSCADPAMCPVPDDAPPRAADLTRLAGIGPGPEGGLYLADGPRVRLLNRSEQPVQVHGVTVPPGAMRTVTGTVPSATPPPADLAQRALAAQTETHHISVAADGRGNLLFGTLHSSNVDSGAVRQLDGTGTVTTLIDARPARPDNRPDVSGCCIRPVDLAADRSGNLYIADEGSDRVWFLNRGSSAVVAHGVPVAPGAVEAVVGAGVGAGTQDEGVPAREAQLTQPAGLALDAAGNLYVVDTLEHSIHRVDAGGRITTVLGTGQQGFNGDGLKGQVTALEEPRDVAVDACGNLLVADTGNDRIRRLNLVASCPPAGTETAVSGRRPLLQTAAAGLTIILVAAALVIWARRRKRRRPAAAAEMGPHGS